MPFQERGSVRIRYREAGAGYPLLVIPGGGLNATIAGLATSSPFNPFDEFTDEYRVIAGDLRNAATTVRIGSMATMPESAWLTSIP